MIDERDAFLAMRLFLEQFYARMGNDMETLIADMTFDGDGKPLDSAAWDDWLRCIEDAPQQLLAAPENPAIPGLRCSFCHKSKHDVTDLIVGPGIYICNECVALCNEIINSPRPQDGAAQSG